MKYTHLLLVATVATIPITSSQDSSFIAGNAYGSRINAISYVDWGTPGTYKQVVDMSNGQCQFENVPYSGGMAPLNGEISLHFRGPMHLKQFAFYTPVKSTKRNHKLNTRERRHLHAHQHRNHRKRAPEIITATINGQVVSWTTNFGVPTEASTTATSHPLLASATPTSIGLPQPSSSFVPSFSNAEQSDGSPTNGWTRQAYYNSEAAHADGLVFLNNHGGAGSGVFDYDFGLSLSYASSDGTAGAASPQILGSGLLKDIAEVSIWTDQKCSGNDCGYYRPGSVAYHGFDGPTKLFLLEFDMPMSADLTPPMNMPAIWALNANIPRTQQYGSCSCWPGCGEWDLFEVLDPGNFRMSSSVESDSSGRDIDWFERPTNKTMKAAILFDSPNSAGHIRVLPADTNFSTSLPNTFWSGLGANTYNRLVHSKGQDGSLSKVFSLTSHISS